MSQGSFPVPPRRVSLVAQAAQSLRAAIETGVWKETLPSERQLCTRLQISRPTLRAALEELRRSGWIEGSARQRSRIVDTKIVRRSPSAPKVISVLSPAPMQALIPLALMSLDSLREHLTEAGYTVQFHVSPACFTARPGRALEKLVHANPSSAWILMSSLEPTQRWFSQSGVRVMVMGSPKPEMGLASIDSDHRAVCRHAAHLLLRKGRTSIAIILPRGIYGGDAESERGFLEAVSHPRGSIRSRVLQQDGSVSSLCRLLDEMSRAVDPPTGIIVGRARPALTAVTHLLRRGIRIPQDIALISRDDDAFLHFVTPKITRYAVDPMQFARRLARAVRQLAEDGTRPQQPIRLMPKFMPGETV